MGRGTWMRRGGALLWLAVALSVGCSVERPDPPERTERERDSLIGQSSLPGARGVRGALAAQDSAAARNARLDSIAGNP